MEKMKVEINNEVLNLESTISTPKSSKVIASYADYYNNMVRQVTTKRDNYNKMLNDINTVYSEYFNNIKEMVGGNND